jgi:subtilisin family serine protease
MIRPPGTPPDQPPAARRPEGAADAAPSQLDADDEPGKVAPWQDEKEWAPVDLHPESGGVQGVRFSVSGLDEQKNARYSRLITSAAHKYFKIDEAPAEGLAAYLVEGRLRVVFNELLIQFKPDMQWAEGNAILDKTGFRMVRRSCFDENEWIVRPVDPTIAGRKLLAAADNFGDFEKVEFAWPNSVAEYKRWSDPIPKEHRWWLDKLKVNSPPGQRDIEQDGSGVVVAVLDDGVDIDHPNLVGRVAADLGRDFNFSPGKAAFSNPRPKINVGADEDPAEGDFHGTLCAGVICSDGKRMGYLGVAPGCKLIAIRVFDGDGLISETRLANAIEYATEVADVISCSWGGPKYPKVVTAINAMKDGRKGKGTIFVCSSGNEGKTRSVDFPAGHRRAIAVGACGPENEVTTYANISGKLDVVAPSSDDDEASVFSTDVSKNGWGMNPNGMFSDEFGSTSAACAMAAGVAALCLQANPNLTATQMRTVLRKSAAKVGRNPPVKYEPDGENGRSEQFGSGCINAAKAVAEAKALLEA